MVKIELTDAGLIELEKIMKQLENTPFGGTLRASLKLDRQIQDERMYVPKGIGLVDCGIDCSIGIMNPLGQCLYKSKHDNGFSVASSWTSDNTGDNFYYKKAKEIEPNTLYYLPPGRDLDIYQLKHLIMYKIYVGNGTYCYWKEPIYADGKSYQVFMSVYKSLHYEIVKV